ncbi:rRNA N6-adenosine-methyltransferase ZCCHC4 isoform X2 [Belonocnema kinseyi]|uniref:rRNA N6-adenosine-methyltransferase ZCCHC4 isoform X2 n=1 Tax=Belonocnema kinseyi TaxID=2817044 RepID=UPI00143DE92D|nr:rRNA N6-adenosine-methyltransferase ZCCHC4 isoform X2 [Belonocnema kinseyi]
MFIPGPTLLFGKYVDGELKKFHACSAMRDFGLCNSFPQPNDKVLKRQLNFQNVYEKKGLTTYDHKKLYLRLNQFMSSQTVNRIYCHTCNILISCSEKIKHKNHDLHNFLTNYQMTHPTEFLKPLSNAKKEAQYFFSEKTTEDIAQILLRLKAKHVLCIGVPRLYEYILHHYENEITCLLLDFDARFHNFFGPLEYAWYNLFNHHFFNNESKKIFKDFLTQGGGKDIYLVCDPPFGGRVEPMSQTIKTIYENHKKWNNLHSIDDELKILFVFPYFMESVIKMKSNPPGITGGLSALEMTDYKVEYDNHPIFHGKSIAKKRRSPVRIFTNVKSSLIILPKSDGYKYCRICQRWVGPENIHCKKCEKCTSKDGSQYKHCDVCERCVKSSWDHCDVCKRCTLKTHQCHKQTKIGGKCFQCYENGHVGKDCKKKNFILPKSMELPMKKKKFN